MTVKELREKRLQLSKEANAVLAEAVEGRMTSEQETKFNAIHADIEGYRVQIERMERQDALNAELAGSTHVGTQETGTKPTISAEERAEGMRAWALGRASSVSLSDTQRETAQRAGFNLGSDEIKFRLTPNGETRALSVGTGSAGGYTVPEGFVPRLEEAMIAWGMVRASSTVVRTATGNNLPFPTANDTSNTGALLSENTQVSEQDTTFGEIELNAYKFSSKAIRVSMELLQDSGVNVEAYLAQIMGERLGKVQNTYQTTGTGTNQPKGIVTCAAAGKTAASQTAITYAELVDLEHSVNPVYRKGAKWMFNDAVLATLKKLLDGENRPLWVPGMAVNAPDRILGYEYVINHDMATPATGVKSVLFGDLSKYLVRECTEIVMQRLVERYADYHQVGFLAMMRSDADLLDAGTNPVKYLIQA